MSLTSLIDDKHSSVRRFMDRELPEVAAVCKQANLVIRDGRKGDAPVSPVAGADGGLVGTAVEYVLPISHGLVRHPQIAGAASRELADLRGNAAELALDELRRLGTEAPALVGSALERAADCALVCARLEQHFRMGDARAVALTLPDPAVGVGLGRGLDGAIEAALVNDATRADLIALLKVAIRDVADIYSAESRFIDPTFALSSAVGGADADVICDGVLIDFKSAKGRSVVSAKELYQVIGYALLDSDNRHEITSVGIHALRWRSRWVVTLDEVLFHLSGVKRDVEAWRAMFTDAVR